MEGELVLSNISNKIDESLILELSQGEDVGVIGGYCEKGFPIYYANNKMAHMLGYEDVDDLITGIGGMVENTIHQDDIKRVIKELNNGVFYDGMTYSVTYRMPKKDGTFLWTVDKGKVIKTEEGKLAIISICRDMTTFIDRYGQLEQLNRFSKSTLENMPSGYYRCTTESGCPFLYINDRFLKMLGWTKEEIKTKFDNKLFNMLHQQDKDAIKQYSELLKQDGDENVIDVIYRLKGKNGYIWVSNSTSLVKVGDEMFYQGTIVDITKFVVKRKLMDETLKEQLMVFDTLARHFQNVYLLDLEKKTARILKLDANYVDVLNNGEHQEFSLEGVIKNWANTIVYPDDREKIGRVFAIDNIKEFLKTKEELVGSYRSVVSGEIHYFQYNISRTDENATKAIAGFQNIDDIIQEHQENEKTKREKENAHQKEIEEQLEIINALSKSFRNVFVANLTDGTAHAIRLADDYNVKAIRDVDNQTFQFDAVVNRWVAETVHPDDKKKVKETLNVEAVRKIFLKQDKYVGTYRNIEDGVQHYYQYDFRRVGKSDNVVVGFRLIDKIVEEQKENQRRERELIEARLKEEKEHGEVIDSLSTIYSTIFRANIKTHEYEILTSVPLMTSMVANKGVFDDVKDIILKTFVKAEFRDLLKEFLDLDTLADRFEKVNTITMDYQTPTDRWMQSRFIVKQRDENGRVIEVLYVARDVTQERLIKEEVEHDPMTGALNRRGFDQVVKSLEKEKRDFALILIDVDNFKSVNDTYGHDVGDTILKKVSKLLKEGFRSIDYVCRIGGDEFAVIMLDVKSDLGYTIMDKISEINKQLAIKKEDIPAVSISVGAAFADRTNPKDSLFKDADKALYYIKQHGRKGCHIYSNDDEK